MKLVNELIITIAFFVMYAPLSIALWYSSGQEQSLPIIMLIGLGIILAYLSVEVVRHRLARQRSMRFTHITLDEQLEIPVESVPEDNYVGFRHLFSQQNHGGGAI